MIPRGTSIAEWQVGTFGLDLLHPSRWSETSIKRGTLYSEAQFPEFPHGGETAGWSAWLRRRCDEGAPCGRFDPGEHP